MNRPVIIAMTLSLPLWGCLLAPSASAASMYDQKVAAQETAYAIENTRKMYEAESSAAAAYKEALDKVHADARRAAEENSRLRPLLSGSANRQIASLGADTWSIGRSDWSDLVPRAPHQNSFSDRIESGQESDDEPAAVLHGSITEIRVEPRKPRPSVVALFQAAENKLIELHDRGRLGSFDMDRFSERLLRIKKNYSVMVAARSLLSPRQESILRNEMDGLDRDINERSD